MILPENKFARTLEQLANDEQLEITKHAFAQFMDNNDELAHLRSQFHYPKMAGLPEVDLSKVKADDDSIYLCGNSLGLEPKGLKDLIVEDLDEWARMGVEGHRLSKRPWAYCDELLLSSMCKLVGASEDEVGIMNALTVNIHLMMISFYQPTAKRHKILLESKAFPSDHYAIESQIELRGYDPKQSMICLEPRENETTLRTEDILQCIQDQGDEIALVFLSGVHYYTGQLFDISTITKAAHEKACYVGWDLAHAIGNVPLYLSDWDVDFAAWCTYKYLCTGAGGIGGVFLHKKHTNSNLPRLTGWWSHKMDSRFNMDNCMDLSPGPSGYRISNPSMLLTVALRASLNIFDQTSMEQLRKKSELLTTYLDYMVTYHFGRDSPTRKSSVSIESFTPSDPTERGCQLSLKFSCDLASIFKQLTDRGVVCDCRMPSVIRITPVHLYNSFTDVYRFIYTLSACINEPEVM